MVDAKILVTVADASFWMRPLLIALWTIFGSGSVIATIQLRLTVIIGYKKVLLRIWCEAISTKLVIRRARFPSCKLSQPSLDCPDFE